MRRHPHPHRPPRASRGRVPAWRAALAATVLVGLTAAVALAGCPMVGPATRPGTPGPAATTTLRAQAGPAPDLQRAENLFIGTCAACHGVRGQGAGMPGLGLPAIDKSGTAWQQSDAELTLIIRGGKGAMPGVGNTWSDDDLRDVLALLRTWWTPEQRAQHDALSKASTP